MIIKKWQKSLALIVAALTVLLLAAILLARTMIDETQLKTRAHERIEQMTGRELQLAQLHLSFFPWPQLQAEGIVLNNPAWAHGSFFVRADTVEADIALIPLLRGKLEIKNITLKGAQINLETDPDGKHNWTPTIKGADDAQLPLSLQAAKNMTLSSLVIQDSTVSLRNQKGKAESWKVEKLFVNSDHGLRNIRLMAQLRHEQHEVELEAKFDDLSRLNQVGASTQGSLNLNVGQAQATIGGTFPLDQALTNFNLHIKLDTDSLKDVYAFLDRPYQSNAVLKGELQLEANKQEMQLKDFKLQLGEMHVSGHGNVDRAVAKPRFDMHLQADKVNIVQVFIDAGRPPLPPKPDGELLHDHPLPWPLLTALQGMQGKLEVKIASLKLRSGIRVSDARAQTTFDGDQMTVAAFTGKLLQGEVHGDAVFKARKKSVQLALHMNDVLLQEWLKQRRKRIKVNGGKMQIDARITTHGDSMKALAAAMSGPIDIRVAHAVIQSQKAGNAEHWLTGLFSAKDQSQVNLTCASGHLVFRNGVAKGEGIVGARSDASQLLTSGNINMRNQTLDLHGRVRARSGVSLGLSNIAGEVKIVGKLSKPTLNLDESGMVGVVARVGAAILTSGVSIIATSIWDGANSESDPCQIVFAGKSHKAASDVTGKDATKSEGR